LKPEGTEREDALSNARKQADWTRFGFRGSIATKDECDREGGRFQPQIFGWMVHVYPFAETPEKIWSQ